MPPNLGTEEVVARRTRATGVQAAASAPGEVAARRPALPDNRGCSALRVARIPLRPPAVAATDRGRRGSAKR